MFKAKPILSLLGSFNTFFNFIAVAIAVLDESFCALASFALTVSFKPYASGLELDGCIVTPLLVAYSCLGCIIKIKSISCDSPCI